MGFHMYRLIFSAQELEAQIHVSCHQIRAMMQQNLCAELQLLARLEYAEVV